jgi:hypothetical protein
MCKIEPHLDWCFSLQPISTLQTHSLVPFSREKKRSTYKLRLRAIETSVNSLVSASQKVPWMVPSQESLLLYLASFSLLLSLQYLLITWSLLGSLPLQWCQTIPHAWETGSKTGYSEKEGNGKSERTLRVALRGSCVQARRMEMGNLVWRTLRFHVWCLHFIDAELGSERQTSNWIYRTSLPILSTALTSEIQAIKQRHLKVDFPNRFISEIRCFYKWWGQLSQGDIFLILNVPQSCLIEVQCILL